ncbi:glycoside hydrolase family 25 protein [Streptomyces sp. NPDC001406]|uniref:glycoside hydrolase family 25 protein n=1 Tax=Streptomyces sp. NPDC001406 TaxID=3364572 RepID=UPI0036B733D2
MATCRGVDVSSFQAPQDWAAHQRAGVVFAWSKASEGQRSRDSRFDAHIGAIIKAGLVPGAYHFAWPNQDPVAEADNYIGAVKPYASARDFVHWLDLERYSDGRNYAGRTDAQILEWAKAWIVRVQAAFPRQRVGVYTSADDIAKGHLAAGVPLWYPAYQGTSVDTYAEAEARLRPSPSGRQPLIWQFTSDPAGSSPRIDLNLCYLSADQLRAWAAGEKDDMPLTDADVKKITDALVPKVADAVFAKLFKTDNVLAAPAGAPDYATNKFWTFQSHVQATTATVREARADAAKAVQLATDLAAKVTPEALAAAVRQALTNEVIVHLSVTTQEG